MDAVEFLVNKLTTCKYFDFSYDAGEALKITQRVKKRHRRTRRLYN